ncbi:MAG: hypothetical protein PQ612_01870 [Rickettsiales bacterium]|nr:hypothetical protein [Pseudomonadota bacterium]MDA0967127.1 hypothetical protein [Pseudomonadota bacterium]MDG4542387.1 hypothetical protein [Rickettsiales bacterium]MDG4544891.1 hypothetical protein [Rickettsiales bacterium]MDG4547014.1 hypothetical protein [Rickettsiales bacterium]
MALNVTEGLGQKEEVIEQKARESKEESEQQPERTGIARRIVAERAAKENRTKAEQVNESKAASIAAGAGRL